MSGEDDRQVRMARRVGVIGAVCLVLLVAGIYFGNRGSGGSSEPNYDPDTGLVGEPNTDPGVGGGGSDTPAASPSGRPKVVFDGHGANVTRAMFGKRWPLSVSSGRVNCVPASGGNLMVIFTADDNTRYALNGIARSAQNEAAFGFKEITPIWLDDPETGAKKDIGVLIDICAPLMP